MKTPIIIATVAFGTLFIGGVGISALYERGATGYGHGAPVNHARSRCEGASTVETMKGLAERKIAELATTSMDTKMRWLIRSDYNASFFIVLAAIDRNTEFGMSAFRERGMIGDGLLCAAIVSLRAPGRTGTALLSTEYSVEPTTDGKVMVTARFAPN